MKDVEHTQLNVFAGSTIDEAIDRAISMTKNSQVVSFSFNGVRFSITEQHSKGEILNYWGMALLADKWHVKR